MGRSFTEENMARCPRPCSERAYTVDFTPISTNFRNISVEGIPFYVHFETDQVRYFSDSQKRKYALRVHRNQSVNNQHIFESVMGYLGQTS